MRSRGSGTGTSGRPGLRRGAGGGLRRLGALASLRRGPPERSLPRGRAADCGRAPRSQHGQTPSQRVAASRALERAGCRLAQNWGRSSATEGAPCMPHTVPSTRRASWESPQGSPAGLGQAVSLLLPQSQVPLALRRSVRDPGTCSLHGTHTRGWSSRVPPSVTRAPFPQPAGTAGRLRVWPTARQTGPYLSVVAAAVLLHAAGQGGEAGLAGLPAGPRRRPVRVGVAGRRVTGCGFQPAGTRERWCVGSRDGGRGA